MAQLASSLQWHDDQGTGMLFQTPLESEAYRIINNRLRLGDSPDIFRTPSLPPLREDFAFDARGVLRSYTFNEVEALRTIPPMYYVADRRQQAWTSEGSTTQARLQAMEEERSFQEISEFFLWEALVEGEEAQDVVAEESSQASTPSSLPDEGSNGEIGTTTKAGATQESRESSTSSLTDESYTDSSRDSSPTHIFTSSASTSTNSSSTSSPSLSPVPLATAASFDRFAAIARAGPRGHLRSPSRSSSHSSASNSSEFVQGSSSGGRSVSSASSNKRKRVWDDEDDEDYKPKPFQDKPKDKGQQKGKKKGNKKPPKPRTTGHPCLVIGCDHEVRLWGTTRDRNRHMDSHFKLLRFVCPGCETPLCRLDAVRRHARERKKNGDPQCWDAYQGAKITDIEIIPPAWNEAEAWKDMHFPGRDDPLYEDAVKLLGRRG